MFLHKDLHRQAKRIADVSDSFESLQSGVQFAIKEFGGWEVHRKTNFNPLQDDDPSTIKVLQICTVPIHHHHMKKYQDNNHCIGVTDELIFDSNKHSPMPLNKFNLDLCCVGDAWVFHHVSLCYEFIPGRNVKSIIVNHKRKCTQNNGDLKKKRK